MIGRNGRRPRRNVARTPARAQVAPRVRLAPAEPAVPLSPEARHRRRLVVAGVLVLLALIPLGYAAQRLARLPAFAVRAVVVKGAERVDAADLLELAAVEPGMPWFALDRRAVELRLESHPWVERAHVRRPWPGRVNLCVQECDPVARVEIAGRTYGLCEDLRVVPAGAPELPLVRTRSKGREKTDPDALNRALDWVEVLRKARIAGDEPVLLEVAQGEGDRVVLPKRGFTVSVDEAIPVSLAARNVFAFLETLDEEGGSRGTLRLISSSTAVWRAAGGRRAKTG